ncbi:MAG: tetratricopeptide repeat protein, partial [Thermoanaerobaculia bacterium]|nr:tetratricopeptide repeat protein [Thermoanaerobaculia bacterium]
GRQLERAGDTEEAAKAYTRATVIDPLMGRAFASLGVLAARSGAGERASGALTRARAAGERGTMVYRARATLLLERGRLDEAIPLLEEILERSPDDGPALRNLAGAKRLLALRYANEEKEEEALEYLDEAATADPGPAEAWKQIAAELGFRAASRVSMLQPPGWMKTAAELLDSAARSDPSDLRIRLRLGVVRLAASIADRDEEGRPSADAIHDAISTLHSVATSPSVSGQLRFSAELHRAIALHAAGDTREADEIATLLTRHPALDAGSRLRARWLQALSLARARRPLPARVLLEESARECEELLVAADLLRLVRLQILKLEADERGAQRLEREAAALEPGARNAATLLLHGLVLASRSRFDEAGEVLEAASREPSIRREANTARTMMQLKRVADLLVQKREAEAHKLLGRLRPSLPPDAEIDRWLNSLEVEGVPLAALRRGDGRSAMAIWSSRAQRFRRKDAEYWELVRSMAIAAHLAAVRAERAVDPAGAGECWKHAITRWLELLDAEEYWLAFARRGQDLFPGLDPGIVDDVRHELVERRLVGPIREVIARERRMGDDLVAIQRLSLIEQIESWRLARNPDDGVATRNLARCHAQRMLLASKLGRWSEAIEFGEKACETDPSDPARFNDIAEIYLAQIQEALASPDSRAGQTARVVELASLALAWNPHHPALLELVGRMAPEAGWAELAQGDSRVRKAEALRGKLPPGALERYMESLAPKEAAPPPAAPRVETGGEANDGGQDIDYADFDAVAMMDLVTKMKARGLSHDAIYAALVEAIPELATRDKQVVMLNIESI